MRPVLPALALACAFAAASAASDDPASRIAEAVDIPVEEWRALAQGRTLTYRIDDEFFALERYAPTGDGVTLQLVDGTCLEGTWDYVEPIYCFYWRGAETACFRHARIGDTILIVQTENGVDTGFVQTMTGVSDVPLACAPVVGS